MNTMIQLREVCKTFGTVRAVRDVNLEIPAGQIVGILGPNGAGKTTTVRMICGALSPSAGTIRVFGMDSVDETLGVRRVLGYLPESAPLYREMRVEEYLAYRAGLFGLRGAERRRRVGAAADRCSLGAVRRRRIGTLSKGFRQRVGLAAVLVHEPKVLILDEPTSGLDPAQIAEMRGLIRDLSGERTMLIVSHILPEVERSCDRVIVFAGGRVLADGAPGVGVSGGLIGSMLSGGRIVVECKAEEGGEVAWPVGKVAGIEVVQRERLEDGWDRLEMRWTGAGTAREARERVARACAAERVLVRELRSEAGTLEELYMKLITGGAGAGAEAGAGENS